MKFPWLDTNYVQQAPAIDPVQGVKSSPVQAAPHLTYRTCEICVANFPWIIDDVGSGP